MNFANELNTKQLEAVTHSGSPIAVFACAGSGKTRVITYRIAYLIDEFGLKPSEILACTFTNKAAGEMKERVNSLVGESVRGLWIGTFHSICLRILRVEGGHLGYTSGLTVMDEEDSLDLVKSIMREMSINPKQSNPRSVRSAISGAKNNLVSVDEYASIARTPKSLMVASVYDKYQSRLEELNSMDFDDLIGKTIKLFEDYPQILDKYRERFKHILVDEYQDINPAQHRLITLLAQDDNLTIVGDDDQSIYAFRGATPGIMLQFKSDFPGAKILTLDVNYRSTQSVISIADQLVKRNKKRMDKNLVANAGVGDKVCLYRGTEPSNEAYYVAKEIQNSNSSGRQYIDHAILYRTNAQSRSFEEALMARGIPYKLIGGIRFYQRKEIKDLIAYLRAIINPSDSISFRRALLNPRRGVGPSVISRLELISKEFTLTYEDSLRQMLENDQISSAARPSVSSFLNLLSELRDIANNEPAQNVVMVLVSKLGIAEKLRADGTEEGEARAANVEEFLNLSAEFSKISEGDDSLDAFLGSVALLSDMDQADDTKDRVLMTTIHQAKGLEFPVVFLCGLEEGTLPHARSLESEDDIEEERRLAYVGMTRAKERLHLTYVVNRTLYGTPKLMSPSRFIQEVESNSCIETKGLLGSIKVNDTKGFSRQSRASAIPQKKEPISTNAGDIIIHRAWGEGVVLSVDGERAVVEFSTVGTKLLNLRYAPVELKK